MVSQLTRLKSLAQKRTRTATTAPTDEARDDHGRWTRSASAGLQQAVAKTRKAKAKAALPLPTLAEMPTADALKTAKLTKLAVPGGDDTLNAATIYKSKIGGRDYFVKGVASGRDAASEAAVYAVGCELGLDAHLLPAVAGKKRMGDMGELPCAVTPYVTGTDLQRLGDPDIGKHFSPDEAKKFLLFDYLTGNTDRHEGNLFVDGTQHLKLIDHEATFLGGTNLDMLSPFYAKLDPKGSAAAELQGGETRLAARSVTAASRQIKLPSDFARQMVDAEPKILKALVRTYTSAGVAPRHIQEALKGVKARVEVLRSGLERGDNLTLGHLLDNS